MFGNWQGWSISALLVIVAVAILYSFAQIAGNPLPPTLDVAQVTLNINPAPRSVVGAMKEQFDASKMYSGAMEDFRQNRELYEGYLTGRELVPPGEDLKVIDLLVQASKAADASIFQNKPQTLITYVDYVLTTKPAIEDWKKLGRALTRAGLAYRKAKQPEQAMKCFQAVFALGIHLYEESLIWEEALAGTGLMGEGAMGMASVAGKDLNDPAQAEQLRRFDLARQNAFRNFEPLYNAVYLLDPHTGNMAALARDCKVRVWRVEGILALGRCQYSAGRLGDQLGARRLLKRLVSDPDPAVQAAAETALGLTREQFRNLAQTRSARTEE